MSFKTLFALLLSFSVSATVIAQDEPPIKHPEKKKGSFWDTEKIVTGGNIGLQLGSQTVIDVSPMIGYKVTDRIIPGIGITYQYYKVRYPGVDFSTHVYGARTFLRLYPLEMIFVHGEYEWLNGQFDPFSDRRLDVTALLAGPGYSMELGGRAAITFMILYDFIQNPYSPYPDHFIIRGGLAIGL
jgi:hypothetical protein